MGNCACPCHDNYTLRIGLCQSFPTRFYWNVKMTKKPWYHEQLHSIFAIGYHLGLVLRFSGLRSHEVGLAFKRSYCAGLSSHQTLRCSVLQAAGVGLHFPYGVEVIRSHLPNISHQYWNYIRFDENVMSEPSFQWIPCTMRLLNSANEGGKPLFVYAYGAQ